MQLQGVGMGATASTTAAATTATSTPTLSNTLTAGLSIWENPIDAVQDIPGVFTLLTEDFSAYGMFAIGALLPVAALALLLLMPSGGGSGRKRG
jgi:hypothetical protein